MDSKKNHKFKYIFPIVVLVLVLIAGVSYAWFTYREEGETSKVIAGSLYLTMNEGNDTINIENIFPETKEEARARDNNFITFTLKGKNTSTQKDINYEIKLTNGTDKSGKERFNPEDLVFDLIEIGDNDEETIILDAVSYDELNEKRIWVDKVEKNTTTEFVKTYKLRMWVDEDVVISDTDPNADYKATGVDAYKNHYASVKVAVEGDLEEKELPLTVVSNSTMVQNGQAYITNTIENVNSENNSDTFELTITSSNDNVRFSYDTTGVNVTNISTEDNIYKVGPLINDETDYEIRGIDNEVELTATFTKSYTILNNQKVEFNIGLVSVNGMETDTDLSFTLKKNNVVIQELVKHVKVKGLSYSVALNIGDSVTYSGEVPNIVADTITMPDGRPYTGAKPTYTYYGNSSCTGTSLSSAPTNAGTYCVKVTIPLENNETTEVTKTFTIDKATVPVTISSDGGDYTGSAMPMDVSPTGAVVKYYTDSACTTGETTTAPVNVGTYYAKASLSNDQNYNDAESSCISYSIETKEIDSSDIVVDSTPIEYDGTAKTPTITITDGTNILVSGTDYSVVYTDNTNAGEATVTITMSGNYTGEIVKHFTINKATDVVILTAKSDVYTGSAIIANTATSVSGTTITYTYYGTSDCAGNALSGAPTDAGNYSVKAESAGNSNYNSGNTCVTHTINKAACTLTTTAQTMYTGDTLTLSTAANNAKGTLSYALKSGGNNTTTPSTISNGVLTGGAMSTANDTDETVDIEITDAGNNNYNGCTKDLVVTVQKYTRTLSWDSNTPAANAYIFASASTATATVTGTGGTAGSVTYSSSNTSYATINASTGVMTVVDPANRSVTMTASLPRTSTVKEATSITRTFVTGEVWAENLSYSNTNSSGINCTGDNATVQCALDSIANLLGLEPPAYYAFGTPTTSSTQDYTTLNKNVFVKKQGSQISLCIIKNGLQCFKTLNWGEEQTHMTSLFKASNCTVVPSQVVDCYNSDYTCTYYFDGSIGCGEYATHNACDLGAAPGNGRINIDCHE